MLTPSSLQVLQRASELLARLSLMRAPVSHTPFGPRSGSPPFPVKQARLVQRFPEVPDTQFPYSIDRTGGWADETMCQGNGRQISRCEIRWADVLKRWLIRGTRARHMQAAAAMVDLVDRAEHSAVGLT